MQPPPPPRAHTASTSPHHHHAHGIPRGTLDTTQLLTTDPCLAAAAAADTLDYSYQHVPAPVPPTPTPVTYLCKKPDVTFSSPYLLKKPDASSSAAAAVAYVGNKMNNTSPYAAEVGSPYTCRNHVPYSPDVTKVEAMRHYASQDHHHHHHRDDDYPCSRVNGGGRKVVASRHYLLHQQQQQPQPPQTEVSVAYSSSPPQYTDYRLHSHSPGCTTPRCQHQHQHQPKTPPQESLLQVQSWQCSDGVTRPAVHSLLCSDGGSDVGMGGPPPLPTRHPHHTVPQACCSALHTFYHFKEKSRVTKTACFVLLLVVMPCIVYLLLVFLIQYYSIWQRGRRKN